MELYTVSCEACDKPLSFPWPEDPKRIPEIVRSLNWEYGTAATSDGDTVAVALCPDCAE